MNELHNGRVSLALHALQAGEGLPLLALHELGGSAQDFRARPLPWPGPVHALDLSGHGRSGRLYGGGYYPELWAADADLALAVLGEAVVLGAGLGAYVALLLAGGRPGQVRCAVLTAGTGLTGSAAPRFPPEFAPPDIPATAPARGLQPESAADPNVLAGQDELVRPPDYAARFAASARRIVLVEDGTERPPWWHAVAELANAERCRDLHAALQAARNASDARPAGGGG